MIRRQHIVPNFFPEAERMREVLDARFKDAYANSIPWFYFCDPLMYTYLRTSPQKVFPIEMFDRFMQRLQEWCIENLGLTPMNLPFLHLMVNGCRLGLHSDFHNGAWGYVYSLTRWEERKFAGGETLLLKDGTPSYKKHHVHGDVLYELVPANFNQLLLFDDRIVHATPTVEGNMDPLDGRIAMVGHIRAASPVVRGSVKEDAVRRVILDAMPHLRDRIRPYKDVQGTISFKLEVGPNGLVESTFILTDNVITQSSGYENSEAVDAVRSLIQKTMMGIKFPQAEGVSTVIVSVLVPIPDLRPLELCIRYEGSREAIYDWVVQRLRDEGGPAIQGRWDGDTYVVRAPIAGNIRIESGQISFSFDPPMWVPSQREHFLRTVSEWAKSARR